MHHRPFEARGERGNEQDGFKSVSLSSTRRGVRAYVSSDFVVAHRIWIALRDSSADLRAQRALS